VFAVQRLDRDQSGFTLVELLVTLSVSAVLMALAGTSLASWSSSAAHKGARDEIVSALRNTAQRALSEGRTYCLAFGTDGSWSTYRSECGSTGVLIGSGQGLGTTGETVTAAFVYDSSLVSTCTTGSGASSCAYFYPRGTASRGTVTVAREGKPTYTINVEQLTSRVYTS
jgi:prepilin-type N-terminal cleavage/methylation domain-containing protein